MIRIRLDKLLTYRLHKILYPKIVKKAIQTLQKTGGFHKNKIR